MIRKLDLSNSEEIKNAFEVIRQLRSHLDLDTYQTLIHKMSKEAYELWVYEEDQEIMATMGFRSYTDFVRGTHIYVDDLVVSESYRSKNIGAKLLAFAEEESKRRGLRSMRLACALTNSGAMKFYEREAWMKRSYNYVKKL